MKVTKIAAQVKTPGRYSIFIDGKFAFGLSELGLIDAGLKIGLELSETELYELKNQAQTDKAYNRVLGLLARRPRSEWEVHEYLRRKNSEANLISEVISKLKERGYIDDRDFARRWVESRRLLRATSRRKLSIELKQKRVEDSVIREILADDETDELDVLKQLIAKKRSQSRYQDETKLIRYLAGQGFSYGDIKDALGSEESD